MIKDLTGIADYCPMCGSERIYMPFPKVDYFYSVHIECADCGLAGFKNFTKDVNVDEAINRTIDYWNTRFTDGILSQG